jgi:short-subunit dehydrogenase
MAEKMKSVLITGASRGIGESLYNKFEEEGFRVFGTSTKKNNKLFQLNLSDKESIDNYIKFLKSKKIKINILINNAGVFLYKKFLENSYDEIENVIRINLLSQIYLTQQLIKNNILTDKSRIINISSVAAKYSLENCLAYSVSKSGISKFSSSLAVEFPDIEICSIILGLVDTDMAKKLINENSDFLMPEEVAKTIFELCLEKKLPLEYEIKPRLKCKKI